VQSVSSVIPSVLEIECHLEEFPAESLQAAAKCLLESLQKHFNHLLDPRDTLFQVQPAAATLLDPTVSSLIQNRESLKAAAEKFIIEQSTRCKATRGLEHEDIKFMTPDYTSPSTPLSSNCAMTNNPSSEEENSRRVSVDSCSAANGSRSALKPLKYLKLMRKVESEIAQPLTRTNVESELAKYHVLIVTGGLCQNECSTAVDFWLANKAAFPTIAPLALDLCSAPVSVAFSERIYSLCGDFCCRRRNRRSNCLEKKVFLKLNARLVQ